VDQRTQNDQADKKARLEKENFNLIKSQTPVDTGSKSKNEAIAKALLLAQDQYSPVMNILNNKEKYSSQEVVDATLKLDSLNNFVENTQAFDKAITGRDLMYRKGVQDGTLFSNPIYENNYQTGYGNKVLGVSDAGKPVLYFIDKNNDGIDDVTGKKGKIGDYEDYSDMENGTNIKYDFQQRFDRDKELMEASTKLQPEINGTDNGTTTRVTTAVNPVLLKDYVSNQMYEADGVTPTAKLKSFARESGVNYDDAKGLKTLSDKFENDIRLRIKGGTIEKRNFNALDAQKEANDERERRQTRSDAKEKIAPKPVVVNANNTAFTEDLVKPSKYIGKDGKIHLTNPGIENKNLLPKGYSFPKGIKKENIGGEGSGLNNMTINTVFKGKDGNMYFTAKVLDEKSSGEKMMGEQGEVTYKYGAKFNAVSRRATGETAAEISRAMGYDSEEAALNALDELNGIKPGEKGFDAEAFYKKHKK